MGITIKDIAKECGLSKATVSLALSDKPSRVSPTTRKKIREVADRLSYKPNQLAVSLITKKSNLIGIAFGDRDMRNLHISESFMAITSSLRKLGYAMIYDFESEHTNDIQNVARLVSFGIEGLIFSILEPVSPSPEFIKLIDYVYSLDIPVVFRNYQFLTQGHSSIVIRTDFLEGAYIATKHLIELGHRRIGCITGDMDTRVSADRLEGYCKALGEKGIPFDERLIYYGDFGMKSGVAALPYLLKAGITAIFSFNDLMAYGVYQAAKQNGILIPQSLSLIGFDNTIFDDVLAVPLTSMDTQTEKIGAIIVDELIKMIQKKNSEQRVITFTPKLLVRESTGPAPAGSVSS